MTVIKTAISLQKDLFENVEATANEMKIPRSRLIALAIEEYLRRWENKKILDSYNEVYADGLSEEDKAVVRYSKRQLGRLTKGDEW